MSLSLCPCCNKLVPPSHFRRAWSREDLAELLNSPQFLGMMRSAIKAELLATAPTEQLGPERYFVKLVPPGWWTNEQAAAELRKAHPSATRFTQRSIDKLICMGRVEGGKGFVLASSMQAYIQRYDAARGVRRSRQRKEELQR
ncbi:MAG: hypothetical protein QY325_04230 [Flavobacteriales bacterium]|nr:MAG: hypothetical protein QY325_04230 [Flavobacteriales bacterium]